MNFIILSSIYQILWLQQKQKKEKVVTVTEAEIEACPMPVGKTKYQPASHKCEF